MVWPWQHSLQYRILFAYGAVFLVTLVLLLIWIADAIYRADLEADTHDLEVTAFLAANALEDPLSGYIAEFEKHEQYEQAGLPADAGAEAEHDGDDAGNAAGEPMTVPDTVGTQAAIGQPLFPRLQGIADRYAGDAAAHVTIYSALGDALADSHLAPDSVPNQAQQPELRAALLSDVGIATRASSLYREPAIFAAAPIKQGEQLLGFVQVSKPVSVVTADARAVLLRLLAVALLALGVATALAIWIGQRLVQPLRRLEEAAFAVAEGDLTQRVPADRNDEVGALGRAFNHMVAQVRATLHQQRMFVANASHELRTPLTNIKLRAEALRSLEPADPRLEQRYLREIEEEADRLTRLADDLLNLARLEDGAWKSPSGPLDVTPILRSVVEIMQLRAAHAGLALAVEIAPDLPKLLINAGDMEAIVVNLLDNAVKYTPPGGKVQIAAAAVDGAVELRVSDDGPGIPREDLPFIFERFYRVDKARSRAGSSGAGLGLSIVRQLVAQNGGAVRVEGGPGQGTVFVVSFPPVA
jgi:signal transduction histidine kinase